MTISNSVHWRGKRRFLGPQGSRASAFGPPAILVGALAVGAAAWLYGLGSLPADAMLPAIGGLFLVLAIAVALTWPRSPADATPLTYWDVAGLLMLIGICAVAAVEPDQMVRLVETNRQP
jgi:peptidoglycan/LPS O-acetylase OafA/YrhL